MRRPPSCVALVARTHWVVGGTILMSAAFLTTLLRKYPVEFSTRTYVVTYSLAAAYLITGLLVWFGAPFGRLLSRVCSLLYLARPQLGSHLWRIMDSPEYQAHFKPRNPFQPSS